MKVLLLLALLGSAVAHHFPGHVEYLTRHADLPSVLSTESIVDHPVMVVTQTTRFAPEMSAILLENGINHMPESFESFHDLMRIGEEEYTLCNAGHSGDVEVCVEHPITKLLVPEIYKDMAISRFLGEMHMPWVRMPSFRSLPMSLSEVEFFDKPILITRTIPISHESTSFLTAEEPVFKSLYNVPLSKSLYTTKFFNDGAFLKSFKPLSKSFLNPSFKLHHNFAGEDALFDSEITKPVTFTKIYTDDHLRSFPSLFNKFDLVKSIKPIVKTEEVIAKPFFKSFDTTYEKPIFKSYIANPFFKSLYSDEVVAKPFLKSFYGDDVVAKPFYKSFYGDDVVTKPFLKNYVSVKPAFKSFGSFVDPAIVPVTKSSSFLWPKETYETLY